MTDITQEEYQAMITRTQRGKFNNRRVSADGHTFDSQAEAEYYYHLKALTADGTITDLRIHPVYVLQERFSANDGTRVRAITYIADFAYMERGRETAVDVKGVETQTFRIKRALFLKRYPTIRFEVVRV